MVQIHFKRRKLGGTDYPETPAHPMTFLFLGIYTGYDLGKPNLAVYEGDASEPIPINWASQLIGLNEISRFSYPENHSVY